MLASGMDSIGVCSQDWLSYIPADKLPARVLGVLAVLASAKPPSLDVAVYGESSEPERFFKVFFVIGGFFAQVVPSPKGALPQREPYGSGLGKNSLLHLSEWIPAGSVSITLYKSTRLAPTVCRGQVG